MDYDDWKLQSGLEDEVVVCNCDECGQEIYEGDPIFRIRENGEIVHDTCFVEYARSALDASYEIAEKEDNNE